MERIRQFQNSRCFPMIMAGTSYTSLACASAACAYFYFTSMADHDFWHWQHIVYGVMFANAIAGFTEFLEDDTFNPLRELLDYLQLVLVLPCFAAQIWVKYEIGPPAISIIHAGLGFAAALYYILTECRRQDLTDLALFGNYLSLMFVSFLTANPFILFAAMHFLAGYYFFKRDDDPCCLAPIDKFNFILTSFCGLSMLSLNENIMDQLQEQAHNFMEAITEGSE